MTFLCVLVSLIGFDAEILFPVDSHQWLATDWGSPNSVEAVAFEGRNCLRLQVTSSTTPWTLIHSKRFPAENWSGNLFLRAEAHLANSGNSRLKIEVRDFENFENVLFHNSQRLAVDDWQTVSWPLPPSLDSVGTLSFVLEGFGNSLPILHLDNLRLVNGLGEEIPWDQMDDLSNWFYFGNWFNWSLIDISADSFPGIEIITSADGSPASPTAALYLQWDFNLGQDPGGPTAEIGNNGPSGKGLNADFSQVDRIGAWVKATSSQVAVRVFFFDGTEGFATASTFLQSPNTWQQVIWSIPWPEDFDRTDVDEIKLVIDGIQDTTEGQAWFDHLTLHTDEPEASLSGAITTITDYNAIATNSEGGCKLVTHLGGAFGELNKDNILIEHDPENGRNGSTAALKLNYFNLNEEFTGLWTSLMGRSDYPEFTLDLSRWQYLRFYVRACGATSGSYNLKLELKDNSELPFEHTAYTYIPLDGSDTDWRAITVSLDLEDLEQWSYNRFQPDPMRAKELVFVFESHFNPDSGCFFFDDIELVDTNQTTPPVTEDSDDEAVLAYLLERNFQYFLEAVHPDTGLVLDRLSFSDLATVAGTGFGLAAWCLGAEIGLLTRDQAFEMASKTLHTLAMTQMGFTTMAGPPPTSEDQIGVNGFFYHFLDSRTGFRKGGSELSSVDTALCLMGVLACKGAMREENGYLATQEAEIRDLADQILERVDWPFFRHPDSGQIYLGWAPEQGEGFIVPHHAGIGYVTSREEGSLERIFTWDYTTDEILLIALAGIAAPDPSRRLSGDIFSSWQRVQGSFGGHHLLQTFPGAAFTYQFANLWLPLKDLPADPLGTHWWQNSKSGLQANRDYCRHPDLMAVFDSFDGFAFGLTACEDPSGRYKAFGTPPAGECNGLPDLDAIHCSLEDQSTNPNLVNGTIAPYGAASSIDFLPAETIATLRHYLFTLGIWNNYFGFPDAYHANIGQFLDAESEVGGCLESFPGFWFNPDQFSIDQGPIVLALGNYLHNNIIQQWVASDEDMSRAIQASFLSGMNVSTLVNQRWIAHITPTANFITTVQITNRHSTPRSYTLQPYDINGNALPEVSGDIAATSTAFFSLEDLFGADPVSHLRIRDGDQVTVSVAYRSANGGSPAHVPERERHGNMWRIFPGDWSVITDAIAVVNLGNEPTDVTVTQKMADGGTLASQTALTGLAAKAKGLYVLNSEFTPRPDAYFDITASQALALVALRFEKPDSLFLWENLAILLNTSP